MVHQSSPRRILLTLSHGGVVPALSRRTGAPCRAVQTRWLVVEMNDTLRLVGCRDRKAVSYTHLDVYKRQVLASCWNDFVLKPGLARLQDSNDYYLGNIQKDGTYSVVPRMPGGEVTPDGLIAVGQVAKKYGLYTKVTLSLIHI